MKNKKILIGITGGIAIYKICGLARLFVKNGADVRVVMTKSATKLISPITFQALTGFPVCVSMFEPSDEGKVKHISLVDWCDIFILAPATANTIGKIANGIADNLLTTTIMALPKNKPMVIAPSMNDNMWTNSFVQRNIKALGEIENYHIVEPDTGQLCVINEGKGRLAKIQKIFDVSEKLLTQN